MNNSKNIDEIFPVYFENVKIIFNNTLVKSEKKEAFESRYSVKFIVEKEDPVCKEWFAFVNQFKDRIDIKDYVRNQNSAQVKLIKTTDELATTASATQKFFSHHYAGQLIFSASTGKSGQVAPNVYDENFSPIDREKVNLDDFVLHDSAEYKEIYIGDVSLITFVRPKGDLKGVLHLTLKTVVLHRKESVSPGIQTIGADSDVRFRQKQAEAQERLRQKTKESIIEKDSARPWEAIDDEDDFDAVKVKPSAFAKKQKTVSSETKKKNIVELADEDF
ncbi:MAG: hypothetical protein ACRCST_11570 [Turicibacter sp.]